MLPPLLKAYDATPASNPLKAKVAEQIALLRDWDLPLVRHVGADIARRLLGRGAVARVQRRCAQGGHLRGRLHGRRTRRPQQMLQALAAASDKLAADFGNWQTPWGDINRFQRVTGDIVQPFDDAKPSIPVGFTSARWGSLASFGARTYKGTKKIYGTSGNSFVAVVEFGDRVRARAVTAGGESGDPRFEALQRSGRALRDRQPARVYFYPDQLKGHIERQYKPGS